MPILHKTLSTRISRMPSVSGWSLAPQTSSICSENPSPTNFLPALFTFPVLPRLLWDCSSFNCYQYLEYQYLEQLAKYQFQLFGQILVIISIQKQLEGQLKMMQKRNDKSCAVCSIKFHKKSSQFRTTEPLECKTCLEIVHHFCYQPNAQPKVFQCDVCRYYDKDKLVKVRCHFCLKQGGIFKRIGYRKYGHVICLIFSGEFLVKNYSSLELVEISPQESSQEIKRIGKCSICYKKINKRDKKGLNICSRQNCQQKAHNACAFLQSEKLLGESGWGLRKKNTRNWYNNLFQEFIQNNHPGVASLVWGGKVKQTQEQKEDKDFSLSLICHIHNQNVEIPCFCGDKGQTTWIQCDCCYVWSHTKCQKTTMEEVDQYQDAFFTCYHCTIWKDIINNQSRPASEQYPSLHFYDFVYIHTFYENNQYRISKSDRELIESLPIPPSFSYYRNYCEQKIYPFVKELINIPQQSSYEIQAKCQEEEEQSAQISLRQNYAQKQTEIYTEFEKQHHFQEIKTKNKDQIKVLRQTFLILRILLTEKFQFQKTNNMPIKEVIEKFKKRYMNLNQIAVRIQSIQFKLSDSGKGILQLPFDMLEKQIKKQEKQEVVKCVEKQQKEPENQDKEKQKIKIKEYKEQKSQEIGKERYNQQEHDHLERRKQYKEEKICQKEKEEQIQEKAKQQKQPENRGMGKQRQHREEKNNEKRKQFKELQIQEKEKERQHKQREKERQQKQKKEKQRQNMERKQRQRQDMERKEKERQYEERKEKEKQYQERKLKERQYEERKLKERQYEERKLKEKGKEKQEKEKKLKKQINLSSIISVLQKNQKIPIANRQIVSQTTIPGLDKKLQTDQIYEKEQFQLIPPLSELKKGGLKLQKMQFLSSHEGQMYEEQEEQDIFYKKHMQLISVSQFRSISYLHRLCSKWESSKSLSQKKQLHRHFELQYKKSDKFVRKYCHFCRRIVDMNSISDQFISKCSEEEIQNKANLRIVKRWLSEQIPSQEGIQFSLVKQLISLKSMQNQEALQYCFAICQFYLKIFEIDPKKWENCQIFLISFQQIQIYYEDFRKNTGKIKSICEFMQRIREKNVKKFPFAFSVVRKMCKKVLEAFNYKQKKIFSLEAFRMLQTLCLKYEIDQKWIQEEIIKNRNLDSLLVGIIINPEQPIFECQKLIFCRNVLKRARIYCQQCNLKNREEQIYRYQVWYKIYEECLAIIPKKCLNKSGEILKLKGQKIEKFPLSFYELEEMSVRIEDVGFPDCRVKQKILELRSEGRRQVEKIESFLSAFSKKISDTKSETLIFSKISIYRQLEKLKNSKFDFSRHLEEVQQILNIDQQIQLAMIKALKNSAFNKYRELKEKLSVIPLQAVQKNIKQQAEDRQPYDQKQCWVEEPLNSRTTNRLKFYDYL